MQNVDDELAERRTLERSIVCAEFVQNTATRPHVALCPIAVDNQHRSVDRSINQSIIYLLKALSNTGMDCQVMLSMLHQ